MHSLVQTIPTIPADPLGQAVLILVIFLLCGYGGIQLEKARVERRTKKEALEATVETDESKRQTTLVDALIRVVESINPLVVSVHEISQSVKESVQLQIKSNSEQAAAIGTLDSMYDQFGTLRFTVEATNKQLDTVTNKVDALGLRIDSRLDKLEGTMANILETLNQAYISLQAIPSSIEAMGVKLGDVIVEIEQGAKLDKVIIELKDTKQEIDTLKPYMINEIASLKANIELLIAKFADNQNILSPELTDKPIETTTSP